MYQYDMAVLVFMLIIATFALSLNVSYKETLRCGVAGRVNLFTVGLVSLINSRIFCGKHTNSPFDNDKKY